MTFSRDKMTPGQIWRRRRVAGLTMRELADLVGVTDSAIEQWESGINTPTDKHKRRLWIVLRRPSEIKRRRKEEALRDVD